MSLVWLCVLVSIICEAHSQMFMSFISCGSFQLLALQTILCPSASLRYSQERPGPTWSQAVLVDFSLIHCAPVCWSLLCLPWAAPACLGFTSVTILLCLCLHFSLLYFHFVLSVSTPSFRSLIIFKMVFQGLCLADLLQSFLGTSVVGFPLNEPYSTCLLLLEMDI